MTCERALSAEDRRIIRAWLYDCTCDPGWPLDGSADVSEYGPTCRSLRNPKAAESVGLPNWGGRGRRGRARWIRAAADEWVLFVDAVRSAPPGRRPVVLAPIQGLT